ncbi:hypothetical protein ACGGKE_10495 [Sphingobium naphthae]|jgi:hypothetical protein
MHSVLGLAVLSWANSLDFIDTPDRRGILVIDLEGLKAGAGEE